MPNYMLGVYSRAKGSANRKGSSRSVPSLDVQIAVITGQH